jgi:tight adherence protein B
MASAGILVIVTLALSLKGLPVLLSLLIGVVLGFGIPHMTVGYFIKRRIAKFTAKFPDAIELLVRGLRSGLPISETIQVVGQEVDGPVGVDHRQDENRPDDGRRAAGNCRPSRHARIPVLRDHHRDPA